MGKLNIPQELSDKISKSLRIKQTDIIDSGGNKPIIREPKRNQENKERDSPVKKNNESTKQYQDSPRRDSPMKQNYKEKIYELPKQNSPKKIFYKSVKKDKPDKPDKSNKSNKLDYIKISKIVFISSIVGGIGITLGIKLGTILFL